MHRPAEVGVGFEPVVDLVAQRCLVPVHVVGDVGGDVQVVLGVQRYQVALPLDVLTKQGIIFTELLEIFNAISFLNP